MKEIIEKLQEQDKEISLLKELVIKLSGGPASTAAEHCETNKNEMMSTDANNGPENQTGPELPLPVPNMF